MFAQYADGTAMNLGEQCFEPGETPTAAEQITPAMVLRAFERIPVPASRISIQPPGGKTLINLDTIFSTEADGFTETVTLLGRRVEFEIRPSSFQWVNGDGTEQVTDWAGKRWSRGTPMSEFITHEYVEAEKVVTRVDTTWSAQYRIGGGPWRDVGGTVTIEGQPFDLAVVSASPHLVG